VSIFVRAIIRFRVAEVLLNGNGAIYRANKLVSVAVVYFVPRISYTVQVQSTSKEKPLNYVSIFVRAIIRFRVAEVLLNGNGVIYRANKKARPVKPH